MRPRLVAPAVVVKIDNVDAARPQTGVNQADVVYEEMVEGGLTRLAAIFQSQYPTVVGPVRSGRLTDAGIADDLNHPVLAYSGTNAIFLPILQSQPLTGSTPRTTRPSFYRNGNLAAHRTTPSPTWRRWPAFRRPTPRRHRCSRTFRRARCSAGPEPPRYGMSVSPFPAPM